MDGSTKLHKSRGTLEGIMSIITAHSRPLFVPFIVEAEEALKPVYIKHCVCAQHPTSPESQLFEMDCNIYIVNKR